MKLLWHICCAPCLLQPFLELLNKEVEITGFFYNPNIHPEEEYKRRREAVKSFSEKQHLPVVFPDYEPEIFFTNVKEVRKLPQERCPLCWRLRLKKTASYAKENNFNAFTTTLLISPYQDHQRLRQIGLDLSNKYEIDFYYQDFRPLFRHSREKAKQQELYRQKYCGCVFSQEERLQKQCRK